MNIFTVLRLLLLSTLLKIIAIIRQIPSNDIDTFIRKFAFKSYIKLGYRRFLVLLINPISSTRYWEFDFVNKNIIPKGKQKVLDVSSPRFFGIYLTSKYKNIQYVMINPDKNDVKETALYHEASGGLNNFSVQIGNALSLPFNEGIFDIVISISVIEHIAGPGDKKATQEMWRVLKPGGKLIITTHVSKMHRIEYRNIDQYGLGHRKSGGKYFFQRMYSKKSLEKRVIHAIGQIPESQIIIGEINNGWFDKYIKAWQKNGLKTTVNDPWYILTKFDYFKQINDLPGIGVIGMVFIKRN